MQPILVNVGEDKRTTTTVKDVRTYGMIASEVVAGWREIEQMLKPYQRR